ncbi:Piwi domain-containing protein [Rhexocercosporidium sp. MPI-PUGE-AT-0058]|nr:Piwi domain-containing protein [Rhexocercosporidium sp. MPI-PUGE-AT-0058]
MSSSKAPSGGKGLGGLAGSKSGKGDYPPHNDQRCDHCESKDHEAQKCKVEIDGFEGIHCKSCGHGDHPTKECPLVKYTKKGPKPVITPEIYDKFTPLFREKYAPRLPVTPVKGRVTSLGSAKSPSTTPKSAGSPSKRDDGEDSKSNPATPTKGSKIPEEIQKAWDDAEKLMPRPRNITKNTDKGPNVLANFFKITLAEGTKLYKYSITLGDIFERKPPKDGEPEFERKLSRETKRYLITELLAKHKPPHKKWACDYDSTIISSEPLYSNSAKTIGQVTETPHTRSPKKQGDPRPVVKSQITYVGLVDVKGLLKHVDGKDDEYVSVDQLRALNIISWKRINDHSFNGGLVGKKFYPASLLNIQEEKANLASPEKPFMIRKGFYSSMRPGVGSVLLNVNTTTSAFFAPIKLSTWIKLCWKNEGPAQVCPKFRSFCKNLRVTFNLHHERGRKWIISDISNHSVDNTTFQLKNGGLESVRRYIEATYNTRINANGYCINVGSMSKKIWYPAELLTIVDWQVVNKVLPGTFGAETVKIAERKPGQHKDLIENTALSFLGLDPKTTFYKDFGMKTVNTFIRVESKKVNPPKLKFKGKSVLEVSMGSWNIGRESFNIGSKSLHRLSVISFCRSASPDGLSMIQNGLKVYGVANGSNPFPRTVVEVTEPALGNTYREICQEVLNKAHAALKTKEIPPIILVVLETHSIPLYAEIKRWGDCIAGVPTVCITKAKLEGANAELAANIWQFNLKLRGVSHSVDNIVPPSTMIVGADCTHPADNAPGRPSIAGIVATNDETSFHYLASARLQTGKQEYIEDLRSMIKERVKAWYMKMKDMPTHPVGKRTGDAWFPKRILFYRDGVSESQYGMVRHQELPQITAGCLDAVREIRAIGRHSHTISDKFKYEPDITLIVVTKRHHARFYDWRIEPSGTANLPPGTVVDSDVVTPNHVGFYLQAHASPMGTARSSHYVVLEDTCKYDMKKLQDMTNKISYTGARATKALSVCTPAQYADFLCDRLRCYMKPAYDGKYPMEPDKKDDKGKNKTSSDYARDSHIWLPPPLTDAPARLNPWAAALDNIMFYL